MKKDFLIDTRFTVKLSQIPVLPYILCISDKCLQFLSSIPDKFFLNVAFSGISNISNSFAYISFCSYAFWDRNIKEQKKSK